MKSKRKFIQILSNQEITSKTKSKNKLQKTNDDSKISEEEDKES